MDARWWMQTERSKPGDLALVISWANALSGWCKQQTLDPALRWHPQDPREQLWLDKAQPEASQVVSLYSLLLHPFLPLITTVHLPTSWKPTVLVSISKWEHAAISFHAYTISLNIISPSSIHIATNTILSQWIIFTVNMYSAFKNVLTNLYADSRLAIVNSASPKVWVWISLWCPSFLVIGYGPKSGISPSYNISISLLMNLYGVFHENFTFLSRG